MLEPDVILERAAEIIEERGWWNGVPLSDTDPRRNTEKMAPVCIALAIDAAQEEITRQKKGYVDYAPHRKVARYLNLDMCFNGPFVPLTVWNDKVANSAEEVIKVLKEAALTE